MILFRNILWLLVFFLLFLIFIFMFVFFIIFTISTFTHICATKSIFLATTVVGCTIWLARVWYHLDQLGQVDFLPFNRYFTDQGFTHSVLVCKYHPVMWSTWFFAHLFILSIKTLGESFKLIRLLDGE